MENTTLIPVYEVTVEFNWKYPGKPIINKEKTGLVQTTQTEDKLIAEQFINSFITNYQVGICEVSDMSIQSVERVFTYDEWIEKYNPVHNEFEDSLFGGFTYDYTEEDQWEFVKKQNPENIWTLVNYDETFMVISGCHWVNRDSYLVSEKPVEKEDLRKEFMVI